MFLLSRSLHQNAFHFRNGFFAAFLLLFYPSCSESSIKQGSFKSIAVDHIESPPLTQERTQALTALGYFDRAQTDNPQIRSVTKNKQAAFDGFYLYGSRHRAEAFLIDGAGNVIHKWHGKTTKPPWMHTILLENGDILAISKGQYLARYSWDSTQRWKRILGAHHDVVVGPDKNIYVLEHRVNRYMHHGTQIPIMDDYIVMLSPEGKRLRRQKLFPLLRKLVPEKRLNRIKALTQKGTGTALLIREGAPADVLHTNSIQVLPKAIPNVAPAGSILLSVREINKIVILDTDIKTVLWSWGKGELEGQHHATLLENGNISIFDNGVQRKQSRIIEMNPTTGKIVWSYTSEDFYSRLRGSVHKLPNGNYLVTESDSGHVFQVTTDARRVWEFWNPDVIRSDPPTRGVIYRMTPYPSDYLPKKLLKSADEP